MLRRLGERGEGSLSYLTVLLLIGSVLAVITVVAIPDKIVAGIKSGVCMVSQEKDCRKPTGDPQTTGPSGAAPTTSGPSGQPSVTPAGDLSPEEKEYNDAVAAAGQADKDAQSVEDEWANFDLLKEIGKIGLDFIAGDIIKCIDKPNFADCAWALVSIVPWGKIGKLLKSIPKIIKLVDRFLDLKRRLDKARKGKKDAKDRVDRALEACGKAPNSFVPGTPVLMADGSRRPIEDVDVGDRVWAADPQTGRSGPRPVTRRIVGGGGKDLATVTVDLDGTFGGATAQITATTGHPFWVSDARDWIGAGQLAPGDTLAMPDGGRTLVVAKRLHQRQQRVFNLTVAGMHTYFVAVGGRDVLVHNLGAPSCDVGAAERAKISTDIDNALKNGKYDDADGLADKAQANADRLREAARNNPTKANKDAANRAQREVDAMRKKVVDGKIDNAMRSSNPDSRLEATTAKSLRNVVRDFGRKYGKNGDLGEIDIETNKAIIEISNGRNFTKADQLKKLMNNKTMNPDGKPVILLATQLSGKQIALAKQSGATVVRTEAELKDALRALGEAV